MRAPGANRMRARYMPNWCYRVFTRITFDLMRRRRLYRLVALPLSLWFVALATDVGGIDACPMHDAMTHAMSASAMAHMAMPQTPAVERGSDAPAPAPHGPMQCTCMGLCCGCAMATLPTTPASPVVVASVVRQAVPIERSARPLAAAPHFRLPPSIGPPALLAI